MSEALRSLPAGELRRLAQALRAGRLVPPYAPLAVRHELGVREADTVAAALAALDTDGMAPRHVSQLLEAFAVAQSARVPIALVATGPDVPGGVARDTGAVVAELFASACQSVLAVGYAVHQGKHVFRTLAERMDALPELRVRLCLDVSRGPGDTSDPSEIVGRFAYRFRTQEWPGKRMPEVLYDPRALEIGTPTRASLHAKCVVVDEERAFVSSANFTEAALQRNIELGVLINDREVARTLARHFEALVTVGWLQPVLKTDRA